VGAVVLALSLPAAAHADSFVRVLTSSATVRTGPGADYREMHVAQRGEVLQVKERGTKGYWWKIELEDGSTGWVFGEEVAPFDIVDDDPGFFTRVWRGFKGAVLGPSPVPYADVELSFAAGVLGDDGAFFFRPAWLVDPYFALEGFVGESPAAQEQVLIAGLGWTLRLIPGATFGPHLHAGIGVEHRMPKADAFAIRERTRMAMCAGAGFEITLKKRITLRADYRHWAFFDENQGDNAEEFSGGLAIFF
jgi:opacity protein-like surface antigen